ncbi:hypothetical protein AND_001715 [Anopheles darlingi]|uniref:Pseudouridine-5'-phosphate glycosidase n=1 Tax=Anopheles darlingi TaxID=43151 RepID=W5JU66_ANODA|nr:hypothetical protein AND_001715 [Anopheles darlingi]
MFRVSSIIRQSVRCIDSLLGVRSISTSLIDISSEVQNALKFTPHRVVALESTIITHGMPYPQNLDTALAVEDIVRQEGAIPATIAIMDGRIKVGLGADQLHSLAKADRDETIKTSRRDMAYVVASGRQGGTTVAGTLLIANSVGIRIFATGGIGGVHRDVAETMDISADLIELGRCPVTVVCSGVKSILDIPRTLEYLETNGVFVSTFGCENHEFPAFYTRSSGSKAPYNFNDAIEAAKVLHVNRELGLLSGMLIGVPIPEQCALNRSEMDAAIEQALQKSKQNGIHGKEATPFILAAVSQLTKGKSLEANMALIKNNARVAAKIAVELDRLQFHQHDSGSANNTNQASETENINRTPLCIGGSVIDISLTVLEDSFEAIIICD